MHKHDNIYLSKKKMAEEFLNQISAKCSVIIIGAGQAGLSIAHSLQKKGIKPVSYTHLTLPTSTHV